MSLTITVSPLRTFGQVITLVGSLDKEGAPPLKQELDALIAADSPLIALDLSGLTYINSQGLRVLQTAMRTMEKSGGALKLLNPPEAITRVFEIVAMPTLTERFSSLEELDAFLLEVQTKVGGKKPDGPKD